MASEQPLAAASTRLRTVPGFPRRPGRPPRPVEGSPVTPASRPAPQVREPAEITLDPRTSGPRLVDVATAAGYLGVSTWTVRDLLERGSLPRVSLPGVRRVLVDQRDLDRLVDASRRMRSA